MHAQTQACANMPTYPHISHQARQKNKKQMNHKTAQLQYKKKKKKTLTELVSGLRVEPLNAWSSSEFAWDEAGDIYTTLSLHSSIALPMSLLNWTQEYGQLPNINIISKGSNQPSQTMTWLSKSKFLQHLVEAHQHQYVEALSYSAREIYLCNAYLEDILVGLGGWLQIMKPVRSIIKSKKIFRD